MSEAAAIISSPARIGASKEHSRRTREDYLHLARELASDHTRSTGSHHFAVSHVSIADVARAAGVSRGALYRLWPSQQDFWIDLVGYILDTPEHSPHAGVIEPDAPDHDVVPSAFIHRDPRDRALDSAQELLLVDRLPLLRAAVVSYPVPGPQHVLAGQRQGLTELDRQIASSLRLTGTRCVDGVSAADIATMIAAIGNGLPITGRMSSPSDLTFDSPPFDGGGNMPRSLLAVMTGAIIARLTEPASGSRADDATRERSPVSGPQSTLPSATHHDANDRRTASAPSTKRSGRREHYLQVAASLALGAPGSDDHHHVFGDITLDVVARAAQVTRRTLTNIWPDQAEFRVDLFSHLLEHERQRVKDAVIAVTHSAGTPPVTAEHAFLALGDRIHTDVMSHLDEVTFLAYAPQLDQPSLAERASRDQDRHADDCARLLRRLLGMVNRRPRPGVSLKQVVIALFTLIDGTNRLARTHPTSVRDDIEVNGEAHSVTAVATAAILEALTEPLDARLRVARLAALLS